MGCANRRAESNHRSIERPLFTIVVFATLFTRFKIELPALVSDGFVIELEDSITDGSPGEVRRSCDLGATEDGATIALAKQSGELITGSYSLSGVKQKSSLGEMASIRKQICELRKRKSEAFED